MSLFCSCWQVRPPTFLPILTQKHVRNSFASCPATASWAADQTFGLKVNTEISLQEADAATAAQHARRRTAAPGRCAGTGATGLGCAPVTQEDTASARPLGTENHWNPSDFPELAIIKYIAYTVYSIYRGLILSHSFIRTDINRFKGFYPFLFVKGVFLGGPPYTCTGGHEGAVQGKDRQWKRLGHP